LPSPLKSPLVRASPQPPTSQYPSLTKPATSRASAMAFPVPVRQRRSVRPSPLKSPEATGEVELLQYPGMATKFDEPSTPTHE